MQVAHDLEEDPATQNAPPDVFNVMLGASKIESNAVAIETIDINKQRNGDTAQRSCNYFCTLNAAINFDLTSHSQRTCAVDWKGYTCERTYVWIARKWTSKRARVCVCAVCIVGQDGTKKRKNSSSRHAYTRKYRCLGGSCTTYLLCFRRGTRVTQRAADDDHRCAFRFRYFFFRRKMKSLHE